MLQAVEDSAILLTAQQGSPDPSSLMRDHPGTLLPELAGASPTTQRLEAIWPHQHDQYDSIHSGVDLRRVMVRPPVGQAAAAWRSCVCDDNKPKAAAAARIRAALAVRKRSELLGLLRPCFARVEP